MDYHHVVEQNSANSARFDPTDLHNTENVIPIPREVHQRISADYSRLAPGQGGLTVRQWLSQQSYEYQYQYGLEKLREYGVVK